jgi:hypothetical protein
VNRVLYVVGTGFTGSTLFSFLLNAHPQIATVGEATGPFLRWDDQRTYPCSCGATLETCPHWKRLAEQMATRGFRFGPNAWDLRFHLARSRAIRQLTTQSLRSVSLDAARDFALLHTPFLGARLKTVARRNEAFVESVLAVTGRSVFLDASKDHSRARLLFRWTNLDLRIIHLVRDAMGLVSSYMKNHGRSLASGIRYWNRTAGHARRLAAIVPPERFLRVRYEDLCTHPEQELARIARWAGLEPMSDPVDFRAHEHHIIGNRMRLASSSQIVLDESWRQRLSPAQREEIERRTLRNRRAFGYA